MHGRAKSTLLFVLRWGIAIVGIYYVLSNINLHDSAQVLDGHNRPVQIKIVPPAGPLFASVLAQSPALYAGRNIPQSDLVNLPDYKTLQLADGHTVYLLAVRLSDDLRTAQRLLVADTAAGDGRWIAPADVTPAYVPHVPHPLIEPGIISMTAQANPWLLIASVAVFPLAIVITSFRFDLLLRVLDIHMSLGKAFVINMVGAFYNTFMPGSTGGDVFKAYYASKLTPHRTRAVMCVLVDRVLGLIALVILGGTTAAFQWSIPACRKVALGSAAVCLGLAVGLFVFYNPTLRRISGLEFILRRLPMQKFVSPAVEAMDIYGRHPWQVIWAVIMTLPVHGSVVVSATLAGFAFGLPLHWAFYWAAVPVIVLSGSIPISPQGAGVMEFFAILLTRRQGVTVAQAFALTMSIRLVQIFWNLTGGVFVLRGDYHAPTDTERESLDTDLPDPPAGAPGPAIPPEAA